jgi:hypothetical protein
VFAAIGSSGQVLHWDGATWTPMTAMSAQVVTSMAAAGTHIFAVGFAGGIARWDGSQWSPMMSGTTAPLSSVWARSASDVWAVGAPAAAGANATALHFDGTVWSAVNSGTTQTATSVTGIGPTAAYFADNSSLYRWDGSTWQSTTNRMGFRILGAGHNAVFATEYSDALPHTATLDGRSWIATVNQGAITNPTFGSDAAGHVWKVGASGRFARYRGTTWVAIASSAPTPRAWGVDGQHVFGSTCSNFTGGTSWGPTACGGLGNAVWGSSASDVIVVGAGGNFWHYDGSAWTGASTGSAQTLNAVWGDAWNDYYAVGQQGTMLHYTGTWARPANAPVTSSDYTAVWGSDATHVFALASGAAWRYDGTQWTSDPTFPSTVVPTAIWGTSPSNVWAVGNGGEIVHYNGSAWAPVPSGTTSDLSGVSGTATNDVFAAGVGGTVLHFDGKSWSPVRPATFGDLPSVWAQGQYVFFGNSPWVLDRTSFPSSGCAGMETSCGDAIDDDCDMLVDCDDPDCRHDPACE